MIFKHVKICFFQIKKFGQFEKFLLCTKKWSVQIFESKKILIKIKMRKKTKRSEQELETIVRDAPSLPQASEIKSEYLAGEAINKYEVVGCNSHSKMISTKELAQLESQLKHTAEQLEALKKAPSKKQILCAILEEKMELQQRLQKMSAPELETCNEQKLNQDCVFAYGSEWDEWKSREPLQSIKIAFKKYREQKLAIGPEGKLTHVISDDEPSRPGRKPESNPGTGLLEKGRQMAQERKNREASRKSKNSKKINVGDNRKQQDAEKDEEEDVLPKFAAVDKIPPILKEGLESAGNVLKDLPEEMEGLRDLGELLLQLSEYKPQALTMTVATAKYWLKEVKKTTRTVQDVDVVALKDKVGKSRREQERENNEKNNLKSNNKGKKKELQKNVDNSESNSSSSSKRQKKNAGDCLMAGTRDSPPHENDTNRQTS